MTRPARSLLLASVFCASMILAAQTGEALAIENEGQVDALIANGVAAADGGNEALEGVDFGTPEGFIKANNEAFDEGTEELRRKFFARFGGVCPVPDEDEDDEPEDDDDDGPPQPPPLPPNPPLPKPRPGGSVITPSGDAGGEIVIELIDAEAEVTVNGNGFNPLDIAQVTALGRQ